VSRNSLTENFYTITPVEDFNIFTGFLCYPPDAQDRDLEDFLATDAYQHFKDRIAVTYILVAVTAPLTPLGFATLTNDAIVVDKENPLPEVANYPYASFPAVKIGRFGISLPLQKEGVGSLFLTMLKKLICEDSRTGCRFITVEGLAALKFGGTKPSGSNFFFRKSGGAAPTRGQ
jgi:hypothetical protein